MMENEEKFFKRNDKFKMILIGSLIILVGLIISLVMFTLAISIATFIFIGLFKILNVPYDSVLTVSLFIIVSYLICLVLEGIYKTLYNLLNRFTNNQMLLFFLYLSLSFPFVHFSLHYSDYLFEGVELSNNIEGIIASFIILSIYYIFEVDGKKKKII